MLIEDKKTCIERHGYITETLYCLIEELKEECELFIKLADKLEREDLTGEGVEDVMGEIMASVVSLKVHSDHVEEEIHSTDED